MDRLVEMGPMIKVPITNRLYDDRWFVLRNLIILLRSLNDPDVIPLVRPLSRHSNNRVRQEALATLVMFKDPASEKQILRDLDSKDREVQLAAIALSEKSHFPDVHKKLIEILSSSGLGQIEYELKSAVVKTLGELRRNESLTEFAKILGSSSLFNSKLLNRLKIDIIRVMERYPYQMVAPLLERLSSGRDDVARQAQDSIKVCKGAANER
jgi:HEAT repeat protein